MPAAGLPFSWPAGLAGTPARALLPCQLAASAMCRQLSSYRGDPDPFKGDVPNQRVRDAAREALDAIFQAQDMSYQPMQAPKLTVSSRETWMLLGQSGTG